MKQNTALALGAATVVAAGGLVALYFALRKTDSSKSTQSAASPASTESTKASSSTLSKTDVLAMYEQITKNLDGVILETANYEQRILEQINQSEGQMTQADQDNFRLHIIAFFKEKMREMEKKIHAAFKTTEEAFIDASLVVYKDDPQIAAAMHALQQKFSLFTGEGQTDPLPERVTMELILQVLGETLEGMSEKMIESHSIAIEKFPDQQSEGFARCIQELYMPRVEEVRVRVCKKYDIDQQTLQAGIMQYRAEPGFETALKAHTDKQKQVFLSLGLA